MKHFLSWWVKWVLILPCGGVALASSVPLPDFETACVGSDHPKFYVIFLQGITTISHPPSEFLSQGKKDNAEKSAVKSHDPDAIDYAALLDKLGKELDISFALPYSNLHCGGSRTKYCWGSEDHGSVAQIYAAVRKSSAVCFSLNKEWGLLGFSNGGYHVGRVVIQGHLPALKWAVAIGSSGSVKSINESSVMKRTPFYLAIGTKDITREKARRFFFALKDAGFNVHYDEFRGGHELTAETLRPILKRALSNDSPNR